MAGGFFAATLVATSLFNSFVAAQTGGSGCGASNPCPEELPCCSQYGECGVGAYCLGGCDPLFSFSLDSCMPAPVCESGDFRLNSLDRIMSNTEYLGDPSEADWVASGEPVPYPEDNPDSVLLTMARGTVGTLLASTHYVWYGNVRARMTTSRTQGVVTAFILLSDVKDEVDFEFVGTDLATAQSNYYFQGIPDYTHGENISVPSNTFENYHEYEIDWTPDRLTWRIDGQELRTVNRDDTWNETANRYDYPQSPARVQLSIWPAGLPTNAQGTIDWAGGEIQWDSEDVQSVGYYYARVTDVNIECYDPPNDVERSGDVSYVLDAPPGHEDNFHITDDQTVLGSFDATGLDPDIDQTEPDDPESTNETPRIPGITGQTGAGGDQGGSGGSGEGDQGGTGTTGGSPPEISTFYGWSQGDSSEGGQQGGASSPISGERAFQGSMLAVLFAIGGVLVM